MPRPAALLAALAAALLLSGCEVLCLPELGLGCPPAPESCQNDSDCAAGQVCFPDGCGDPGQSLALEVVPADGAGAAQDYLIPPNSLKAVDDVQVCPTSRVSGGAIRATDGGTPEPYANRVALWISGESALIPGVHRRYGPTATTSAGGFSLQTGSGSFVMTALPGDLTIPPVTQSVAVEPGSAPNVNVLLPAPSELVQLFGLVLETVEAGPVGTALEIQALDASERPLSQRVPVGALGEFTLVALRPQADSLVLRVSSAASGAFVPEKRFEVSLSSPILTSPLELGAYGAPVRLTGTVVGPDQAAVEGATVYVEGQVGGGGFFRSPAAATDAGGSFALQTLAGMPATAMRLTVVPPALASNGFPVRAGLLVTDVAVPAGGGSVGTLACPPRVKVTGQLLNPDGTVATGVPISAQPLRPVEGHPLPDALFETKSGITGLFELDVDPATYRLDFFPVENLPRASRFVTVAAREDGSGQGYQPVALPPFSLSNGRTLQGTVKMLSQCPAAGTETGAAVPYSSVRFFRLTSIEGLPGSVLLAQGVADANGNFSVVLPTR